MDIQAYMQGVGREARRASRAMAMADTAVKNRALLATADAIAAARETILVANADDMARGRANGLDAAMLDRLELKPAGIDAMIEGVRQVATLADPIGAITDLRLSSHRHTGRPHACAARRGRHHL